MKKIGLSFIALAFALVIPFSTADAAGNGSWESVGTESFYYNSTYDWWDTPNVHSTGGDFKITTDSWFLGKVQLWEYDPGSGNDDYVGEAFFDYQWDPEPFRSITRFVDGSNNKAEFYVRSYYNPGSATIYFSD